MKSTDKFLLAVLIIVGLLIMLLTIFVGRTVTAEVGFFGTPAINVMFIVLAVVYLAVSAYLLIQAFYRPTNVRKLVVYADCGGVVKTTVRVVRSLIKKSTAPIVGVRIRKTAIHDGDTGPSLHIKVHVKGKDVNEKVEAMRKVIDLTFTQVLRITFRSIDFDVTKVRFSGSIAIQPTEKGVQDNTVTVPVAKESQGQQVEVAIQEGQTANDTKSDSQDSQENIEQDSQESIEQDSQESIEQDGEVGQSESQTDKDQDDRNTLGE